MLMRDTPMLGQIIGGFASLSVVFWPVIRGVPWKTVCEDVGFKFRFGPIRDTLTGLLVYLVTLPILGFGVAIRSAGL